MSDSPAILARAGRLIRLDVLLACGLAAVGELEVLLRPGDGDRLVSAVAVAVVASSLAWRRSAPLPVFATIVAALLGDALLGGFLVERCVAPLVAAVLALYAIGRFATGTRAMGGAAVAIAALVATRIAFDPALASPTEAVLSLIYVPLPLLVGRWLRGQALLQRELVDKRERLELERERDARQAAEEERMRIATDLQAAVTDGVSLIVRQARDLSRRLAAGEHAQAGALLAEIGNGAREALADVRRVLGILRHDGPPRLAPTNPAPPGVAAPQPLPAQAAPVAVGDRARSPVLADPRRLDRALVAVLLVAAEIELAMAAPAGDRLFAAVSAVAIVIPLLWRRRWPVAVAAAVLGAIGLQSTVLGLDPFPVSDVATLICASFAVGAHAVGRPAFAGLALLAAGTALHAGIFHPDGVAPALLGGALVPWIAGRTARSRRLLTRELQEKAELMQRSRAQDAEAATTAERVSVARELHDVVAHNISVIAIQAGGAEGIVARDPERAAQCAALIEAVGREALAELGRLLDRPGDDDAPAPQPSLTRVSALAQRARDAGLPVELHVDGDPAPLPAGVDLAAYRIVQEALANTSKHAHASRAWVVVRYAERAVQVEISDDGHGPNGDRADTGCGHGLIGMRERVGLYGGTLDVGSRPSGGFLVRARLPVGRT